VLNNPQNLRDMGRTRNAVGSSVESNAHGADENVRIRDLKDYVRFLVGLLT
jgi:acetylornithine deacetylase/succinyl-diaminopimelate desuccinylase-like protein